MLFFGVLPLLLVAVSAKDCFDIIATKCKDTNAEDSTKHNDGKKSNNNDSQDSCTALTEQFTTKLGTDLSGFANANIQESFHLLMMSSYFDNFSVNRKGFKKLYRQYSDKLWEDGIDIMKYLAKRGFEMKFTQPPQGMVAHREVALEEMNSLAMVLDIQKTLANALHTIYTTVHTVEPTTVHYIQERFLEAYTDRIWELASYLNELKDLSSLNEYTTVTLFFFDEYLQKTL